MKTYVVNEVFYSIQGEGVRAGTANLFVRFAGCNLRCSIDPGPRSPGGFDCDTEFESGRRINLDELAAWVEREAAGRDPRWLILTGGEPGLQVDHAFCDFWHGRGWKLAIETNGSVELPAAMDWITVSPKVAEHAIRQRTASEVKYVRGYGQAIPKTVVQAKYYLISPAFNGLEPDRAAVDWCVQLVKENPQWRLSLQFHKFWRAR